jgi:fructokinase
MSKLIAIGEVLIDFIPEQSATKLQDVTSFHRQAGGAPANVAAAVARLGGHSLVLSKLGKDAFGDHLIATLDDVGVDTRQIQRTDEANTALAFVSLDALGNRDFSFYRNPSADMLLSKEEIDPSMFRAGDILHFCSVDLIDAPVKDAHRQAIQYAKDTGMIISFDPNLRFPLWPDKTALKRTVWEFLPQAHILKLSDEELPFLTGETIIEEALSHLFVGDVQVIVYTKGPNGSSIFTKQQSFHHDGYQVQAVDTTGSGDTYIGALLYRLLQVGTTPMNLASMDFTPHISFANAVGALVATRKGAIPAMPTQEDIIQFQQNGIS